MFASPGSVAFSINGFEVYYYGIIMAFAIFISILLSNKIANIFYHYNNQVLDFAPIVLLSGFFGARFYYIALNFSYYFSHPLEILAFRSGGLSIHGALLGGILGLLFISKKYKMHFWEQCDIFSYSLPLAQSIARWGNFFNSEAFGYPTDLPWKLYIPLVNRPDKYVDFSFFHPTFLYESILDILIFFIMLYLLKNKDKFHLGTVTMIYLILYSLVRIFVEGFRIDCIKTIFGIQFPIFVSVLVIIFSLSYIIKKRF